MSIRFPRVPGIDGESSDGLQNHISKRKQKRGR